MHICFVCREYIPSLRGGGIASYIKEVAHGLCKKGHKVTVICASDNTREESSYKDGKVSVIRLRGGDFVIPEVEGNIFFKKLRIYYRFHSYRKRILSTLNRLSDVDVVEVADYGAESFYLKWLKLPVVLRLHTPMLLDHSNYSMQNLNLKNLLYYWQGREELLLIKKAMFITSCSASLKEWAEKFIGITTDRTRIVYNPIQIDKWKGYARKEQFNKKKQILFAGTICDWKGSGDLAEACALLNEQTNLSFEVSFIGKMGNYAAELQKKYGNQSWFKLIGKVEREELMTRYTTADLVCFPSWWENMPMVCIEAMLCGAIVLGSNSGGMSEIITDGINGFLIPPRNPQVLADKINELLEMTELEKKLVSINAQKRIKDAFSIDVILKQQIDYYNYVIENF